MQLHAVYKATFQTRLGTKREYWGQTTDVDARRTSFGRTGKFMPGWAKAGCRNLSLEPVLENIAGLGAALVLETMTAAHAMKGPALQRTRGGAWLRIDLLPQDRAEIKDVQKCSTPDEVLALVQKYPKGHLAEHLQNVTFTAAAQQTSANSEKFPNPRMLPDCALPKEVWADVKIKIKDCCKKKYSSGCQKAKDKGLSYKKDKEKFSKFKWGPGKPAHKDNPAKAHARHTKTWRHKIRKKPAAAKGCK